MQNTLKKTFLALSISFCLSPVAFATNGLAPTGLGQVHKAMGGAAAGNPLDTMSMATNPASASFIKNGFDVELEYFKPNRKITRKTIPAGAAGAGSPEIPGEDFDGNEKPSFLVPGMGYKKGVNNKLSLGIVAYGNGGMNTEFKKGPNFYHPTHGKTPFSQVPGENSGINLEQLFIAPTLGVKLNSKHSVGISANLVYQRFEAKGLQSLIGDPTNPSTSDPENFTSTGKSSATGIGATLGWMGRFSDKFTLGASYRLKTKMGKFKEYAGLFPDGGRMDVPAALTVGVSSQITPRTLVAMDVQQIYYSKTHAIGNPSSKTDAQGKPVPSYTFGSDNGPGFGWDDQTVIKVGVKQKVSSKLALMAGYNHGKSPLGTEDTFFGSLAPGIVEDHLSLGFDYGINKYSSIVGSYTRAFKKTVKGDFAKKQPFDLEMDQHAIGIGYSRKF